MSLADYLYYEEPGIALYCGDCRDVLPLLELPVDLVLTDPPYGHGERWQGGTWGAAHKYREAENWDKAAVTPLLLDAVIAAGREAIVWGGNYFTLPPRRGWLAWVKRDRLATLADMELAWTTFDKPSKCFESTRNVEARNGHATEKPIRLLTWCIAYANNPASVADPFCGSGSTLVAAKGLGLQAIGIEIEPKYCDIAVKRLRQEVLAL